MAQSDAIAVSIPESDLAEIRASIATLRGKLMPHLKTLNAQGKRQFLHVPAAPAKRAGGGVRSGFLTDDRDRSE